MTLRGSARGSYLETLSQLFLNFLVVILILPNFSRKSLQHLIKALRRPSPNLPRPSQKLPNPPKSHPKPSPNHPKPSQNRPQIDFKGLLGAILDPCLKKVRFLTSKKSPRGAQERPKEAPDRPNPLQNGPQNPPKSNFLAIL